MIFYKMKNQDKEAFIKINEVFLTKDYIRNKHQILNYMLATVSKIA